MDDFVQQALMAALLRRAEDDARRAIAHAHLAIPGVIARLRAGKMTDAEAARELRIDTVELVGLKGKHGL